MLSQLAAGAAEVPQLVRRNLLVRNLGVPRSTRSRLANVRFVPRGRLTAELSWKMVVTQKGRPSLPQWLFRPVLDESSDVASAVSRRRFFVEFLKTTHLSEKTTPQPGKRPEGRPVR